MDVPGITGAAAHEYNKWKEATFQPMQSLNSTDEILLSPPLSPMRKAAVETSRVVRVAAPRLSSSSKIFDVFRTSFQLSSEIFDMLRRFSQLSDDIR